MSGLTRNDGDGLVRVAEQRMLDAADLTFAAYDGAKLIGYARSLTDFCFCCYLSDLAVRKEYQSKGIGKELVARTKEIIGEQCMLLLLSAPGAMDYYSKIGMEKVTNGFIIKRLK